MFEYFEQVHQKRFLAAGGVLKPALKKILKPETTEDLIFTDENPKPEENSEETKKVFAWDEKSMQYLEKDCRKIDAESRRVGRFFMPDLSGFWLILKVRDAG